MYIYIVKFGIWVPGLIEKFTDWDSMSVTALDAEHAIKKVYKLAMKQKFQKVDKHGNEYGKEILKVKDIRISSVSQGEHIDG